MTKSKAKQIRVPPRPIYVQLRDMNQQELEREIKALPLQISKAREHRDALWVKLKTRWPEAFVNDEEFVRSYVRAEAAGNEVVSLLQRLVKASGIWNERYSNKLPL